MIQKLTRAWFSDGGCSPAGQTPSSQDSSCQIRCHRFPRTWARGRRGLTAHPPRSSPAPSAWHPALPHVSSPPAAHILGGLAGLLVLLGGGLFAPGSLCGSETDAHSPQRFESTEVHMGTAITIVVYAANSNTANTGLRAAFDQIVRVDRIMSDYKENSELSRLSRQSPTKGQVPVSEPLWEVLAEAQRYSQLSDGAFDVTVGPLSRLWRRARRQQALPSEDRLIAARHSVGHRLLVLHAERREVELRAPDMRLDLGGIAKGYAADQALGELKRQGLCRAIVNAGGDMAIGAAPPGKQGWTVGVAPRGPDAPPSRLLLLADCGVATSGDAWQFVEIDGRRFSHILDPRTGLGLTDRSGVTVVAPTAMAADALASTLSVLGPQRGLKLAESLPGVEALIVRQPADQVEEHATGGFDQLPKEP